MVYHIIRPFLRFIKNKRNWALQFFSPQDVEYKTNCQIREWKKPRAALKCLEWLHRYLFV